MSPNSNVMPAPSRNIMRKRHYNSEGDMSDDEGFSPKSGSPSMDDDRRAHHNELERRRRDHIKDHFLALKNTIPLLEGEKSSRALILKRAVDYISLMQSQLKEAKLEVEDQKRQNDQLRHHAAIGFMNQSAAISAAAAVSMPSAPQQQQTFTLSANTVSPFACMNLPTTSAQQMQPNFGACANPTVSLTDCFKPSSPIASNTIANSGAYGCQLTSNAVQDQEQAKQALISSLLLQNFGQLMQPRPQLQKYSAQSLLAAHQLSAQF